MKVCDVVLNSVWYDPRVRKQISEYLAGGNDLVCVGLKCSRYDEQKVAEMPCRTTVIMPDPRYDGRQRGMLRYYKYVRKIAIYRRDICNAIVAEKPDVIHANDLDALIPAYRAAKKLKCAIIYDSHEINTENLYYRDKRFYAWLLRCQERRIIKKVDKMVCVSHAAADYFAKTYSIEKPMVVTNCSLKAEQSFSEEKNEGFEVLNHGQYYAGRGYDIMVEALPLLKDYPEIKLALRGFGAMEESLRARAKDLGDENIVFYPKVLVQELIPMAARSMVGVAITEGTCINFEVSVSNKLFEYASAGLPVIMSDIPEHRYLNDKYHFGIVMPDNRPETFADAVKKLYMDKEFYNACAANARKLSDEICWETEFGKLIEAEKSIVAGK